MLKANLSTQPSFLSAFVISKTMSFPKGTLNTKVCGSKSTIFHILLCSDHLSNNDNSKMAWVFTLILARNWCLPQHIASQPLSNFIASNLLQSKKLFPALPGCCPLRRTPFSNLVRMRTSSLVSKPITTVIGLGTRMVHAWNRACVDQHD